MTSRWAGVRERLDTLRRAHERGETGQVFGADGHAFVARPPLTPQELDDAETQLGVRLPQAYRGFLLEVSAGGAGPYYGLFPLTRDPSGQWGWHGDGADLFDTTALGTAFDPGDVRGVLADLDRAQPPVQDHDAYGAWLLAYDDVLWAPGRTLGAVCLCHEGCAHRDWLVVTGPHRGEVWDDDRASDVDLTPHVGRDGSVSTFDSWYLSWLVDAERTVASAADASRSGR